MKLTSVDVKKIKTLEDLAVSLTSALLSLMTLQNEQVRALELGIMKEDMNERANTMIWDIRRLINHYKIQLEAVLELLPDDFNAVEVIKKMQRKKRNAPQKDN